MPRIYPDEDDMVYACPECDSAPVYERTGKNTHAGDPDDPYICQKCRATFDQPVKREKKHKGPKPGAGSGRPTPLEDLNPEDVGLSPIGDRA